MEKKILHRCFWWCHHGNIRSTLFMVLFCSLAVLGFVIAVGVGVDTAQTFRKQRLSVKYARAGYWMHEVGDSYQILPRFIKAECGRNEKARDVSNMVSFFGVISSVEGNKVSVSTNAASEQLVVSDVDTHIFVSSTEIGIGSLKVGQGGIFFGVKRADGTVLVSMVKLQ